jgi:hypothetical protein
VSAYDRLRKRDKAFARLAHRAGVPSGWSSLVIEAAVKAGIPRSRGFALIQTETNFRNIYGHDPTIFAGHGRVTADNYARYKRERGHTHMQGVGPAQLTYWSIQDDADRIGGCWKPEANLLVGFRYLAESCRNLGTRQGIAAYNGAGAAAQAYASRVMSRERGWKRVLLGLSRKAPK